MTDFNKPKYHPIPPSQKTHGMSFTKQYKTWSNMKDRCLNKKSKSYPRYGGRGIKVCKEWISFERFYKDMGEPPKDFTLERVNNDGNYTKSNCIWASKYHQNMNRSITKLVVFKGKIMFLVDCAKETGINYQTIRSRINCGCTGDSLFREKYARR